MVPSLLFSTLVVRSISVSTLYPMSIKSAPTVATESGIPNSDIPPTAIIISHNAAAITASEGTRFLNIIKTVMDMNRNANASAK